MCGNCVSKIESALAEISSVKSVDVNLGTHIARISISKKGLFSEVINKLDTLGYRPRPVSSRSELVKSRSKESKSHLNKVAVSAVLAGNIMLFSFSTYSGADGDWKQYFEALCGFFFLGTLTYCCTPFYIKAYNALRARSASIDLPIVLSILVGSGISYYHLILGKGDIYFDSLSILVFLILSSRYVLSLYQEKLLNPSYIKDYFKISSATKMESGKNIVCAPEEIQIGDTVLIKKGDNIPVDGVLLSEEAWLDSSVLTGENLPLRANKGAKCFAGTVCLSESISIRATEIVEKSRIGLLVSEVEKQLIAKTPLTSLADKLAQYFTITILVMGGGFFLIYSHVDFYEALNRTLALVILACPCALAFATPLGQSIVLAKLARIGIFVKNGSAIEKLSKIKTIVFDKTGTLSEGVLEFKGWGENLPNDFQMSIMLSLEKDSSHPVAKTLRELLLNKSTLNKNIHEVNLKNKKEILGKGIFGEFNNIKYSMESVSSVESCHAESHHAESCQIVVGLFENSKCIVKAHFGDVLRNDTKKTVSELKNMGFKPFILSGDNSNSVKNFAEMAGFSKENIFSNASPEDKQKFLQKHSNSLMVGDGANDLLALSESSVSATVKGSLEVSLKLSDIYLGKEGIYGIVEVVQASKDAMKVIKTNLGISLFYNIAGAGAALFGFISPLAAAILMPLSSSLVVGLTLLGTPYLRRLGRLGGVDYQNRKKSKLLREIRV